MGTCAAGNRRSSTRRTADRCQSEKTRLVCVGGASNLLGTINDVGSMCRKAREAGAWTYIDAVQSAPHIVTDVQAMGCDFLACSAYKFFGPHQGILYGRRDVLERLEPYKVRPAPDTLPWCFETGTQSHEGMAGTAAAVDYFAWVGREMADAGADRRSAVTAGMELMVEYEKALSRHLIDGLGSLPGVTVHGITADDALDRRVPTVIFTHDTMAPKDIASALAAENIFVWSGHNYALEAARARALQRHGRDRHAGRGARAHPRGLNASGPGFRRIDVAHAAIQIRKAAMRGLP